MLKIGYFFCHNWHTTSHTGKRRGSRMSRLSSQPSRVTATRDGSSNKNTAQHNTTQHNTTNQKNSIKI